MPQQISDKIRPSKLATKTQKTIEKQRQTHIGVEETTLLEKGKPRYGEETDGRDIKPRMTKKSSLISNEQELEREYKGKGG